MDAAGIVCVQTKKKFLETLRFISFVDRDYFGWSVYCKQLLNAF